MFCKLKSINTTNSLINVFYYLARIFHYPLILFLSIYVISNRDNILIGYFGSDILFYVMQIKMFSKAFCVLLCLFNTIQIAYEILLNKTNDTKKNDRMYALRIIMNILKTIVIVSLIVVLLVIFDIKPVSLLVTVGTPLTLLSLVLKNTIEDLLFGIYLMLSGTYKRGDHIFIQDRNIE